MCGDLLGGTALNRMSFGLILCTCFKQYASIVHGVITLYTHIWNQAPRINEYAYKKNLCTGRTLYRWNKWREQMHLYMGVHLKYKATHDCHVPIVQKISYLLNNHSLEKWFTSDWTGELMTGPNE